MSPASARLLVDICGYWITGDGAGRGYLIDRAGARDGEGLPYLPGRHLRGLLREGMRRAVASGMRLAGDMPWPPDAEAILFGREGRGSAYRDRAGMRSAGLVEVRDARLPEEERAYFARHRDAREALSRTLAQTAMVHGRGVARSRSLRVSEVFVPMRLVGDVGLAPFAAMDGALDEAEARIAAAWREAIACALCFVEAVGGGRRHGLGRAVLDLAA